MSRSLRTKVLGWYSVVLLTVLATFAAVAVWSVWRSSVRDMDDRLAPLAARLARAVNPDATGGYEINLAADDFAEFESADDAAYYAIWAADGALIDRSDPQVDATLPRETGARIRGGWREVIVRGNHDAVVLVGRSLAGARANRREAIVALGIAGSVALILASIGGWVLVGRALSPIGRIARTAEAMSESNLGLRIHVDADDELGRVAATLNRAFDRLQEAFERQTRFTADASHELRTPLASQLAEMEWALARPRSEAELEQSLRVGLKAAHRMQAVVEGLLTLARADAGAIPRVSQPVDLAGLTEEIVDSVRASATERDVHVRVEGERTVIEGDPDRLRELISNLVTNAVQHSGPGSRVTCTTSSAGGKAILDVSDNGFGIDPADLPHLFERFYRANKARSRAAGGAGLGLAISKWIAESHGGRIQCESETGRGTRFWVEFPSNIAV